MNKHLITLAIVILLICVGLSGCLNRNHIQITIRNATLDTKWFKYEVYDDIENWQTVEPMYSEVLYLEPFTEENRDLTRCEIGITYLMRIEPSGISDIKFGLFSEDTRFKFEPNVQDDDYMTMNGVPMGHPP